MKLRKDWIVNILRVLLSATLLFSGFVKGVDPMGGAIKISEYLASFSLQSFSFLAYPLSIGLSSFEFLLGGLLLMGFFRKQVAFLNLLFMGIMTLVTLYLYIYNPISDCGCFGDAIKLTNGETFLKNIVLLLFSVVLFAYRGHIHTIASSRAVECTMEAILLGGWVIFIYTNAVSVPMLDFRPYKVGRSLRDLVIIPPEAPRPVVEFEFIYEKDGVQKSFGIDNLPSDDSWTYVDRKETVISEGYIPEITDFYIYRQGNDITHDMLTEPGRIIWILSPNWSTASASSVDRINALYHWAQMHNTSLYGISGSTNDEQGRWRNRTSAAYTLLFMDAVTIKTIARSNPAVLFLKDGVIVGKISASDLPKEEDMDTFVQSVFEQKSLQGSPYVERWALLAIWLVASLVLFICSWAKYED